MVRNARRRRIHRFAGIPGYGHGWFRTSDLSRVNWADEAQIATEKSPFAGISYIRIRPPESAMRRDARGYVADSGISGEKCLKEPYAVRAGDLSLSGEKSLGIET